MRIEQIRIHPVSLPFRGEFPHSMRRGCDAENVVVAVIAKGGAVRGYGEAAPRAFVTGESQKSVTDCIRDFARSKLFPWNLDDVGAIWRFVDEISGERRHHSAICALETALLDALGKHQNRPVMEFFSRAFSTDTIHYGAALPLADAKRIREISRIIRDLLQIRKIKLKLGRDKEANRRAFEAVWGVFGKDLDLKVDVNGVWDSASAMAHGDLLKTFRVRVVEQPVMPDQPIAGEFAALLKKSGIALMADESACTLGEVQRLHRQGHYNMVNVRLSKCGGFRNALRMVGYLRQRRIPFQIGCHLGESGILSAAGRILSLLCRDAVYHDGSYDAYLLKENLTTEDVTFAAAGKAGSLKGPGLGVAVDGEKLKKLSGPASGLTLAGKSPE